MKRTLFRRGGSLNRFVSLWVALSFVLSLTNIAYAVAPDMPSEQAVSVEAVAEPAPSGDEQPASDASELAPVEEPVANAPVEEPAADVPSDEPVADVPADEPVAQTPAESTIEQSVTEPSEEAAPVTVSSEAAAPSKQPKVTGEAFSVASIVTPVEVAGNPALGPYGVRIDGGDLPAPGDGDTFVLVYGSITATVTISVYDSGMGPEFDFTSTWPITSVVVKGGPIGANVYSYSPSVFGDTGLHTPVNPQNEKYSGLSHLDFYLQPASDLKVYKFEDLDRDGVHDEGEPLLSGWMFQLKMGSTVVASAVTNGSGFVHFTNLAAGSYTVSETMMDDWVVTSDPYPVPVSLSAGESEVAYVGNAQVSDLSVVKFHDLDGDGMHDEGEEVLSGWTIQLLADDEVVDSAVTDDMGKVVFSDLVPGSYAVTEVIQSGWFNTTELPVEVALVGGQDQTVHIGNAEHPDLTVLKFLDIDRDGERDEGESVLSGWTFQLKQDGEVIYSAVTDENGLAVFSDVMAGEYELDEVVAPPWFATTTLPISLVLEPNVDESIEVGNSYDVTKTFQLTYVALPEGASVWVEYSVDGGDLVLEQLSPMGGGLYGFDVELVYGSTISGRWIVSIGQQLITLAEFGPEVLTEDLTNTFVYDSVVGGLKYGDDDGDGVRDEDESGLAGWVVNLFRFDGESMTLFASTVTGEGGAYAFVGLPPGTYSVEEVMQEGWEQTDAPEGTFVVSGESQQVLGLDFGNTQFAPFPPEQGTSIVKSADKTEADPGDIVTYTLTYKNTGEVAIEVVTITDDYDERYSSPEDVGDGVVSGGKITWERFDLMPGETRTITYTMKIDEDMPDGTTVVDNTAVIEPFGDSDSWRVTVENPSLPFTDDDEEPFLPFTGTDLMLLALAGVLSLAGALVARKAGRAF